MPRRLALALVALFPVVTHHVAAAPPTSMTPVDLLSLPSVGAADLSPDGERVVYIKSEANWEKNRREGAAWLADVESGAARQLLYGRKGVGSLAWSPGGKWLAFVADGREDSTNQAYLLPLEGGDAFPLTEHPTSVRAIDWGAGDDWVYFLAPEDRPDGDPEHRTLIRPFDQPANSQLWRVSVPGGAREQLTEGPLTVLGFDITEKGLLIVRSEGALLDDRRTKSSLWIAKPDGTELKRLDAPPTGQGGARLSPSGEQALYLAGVNSEGVNYHQTNLFVLDIAGESGARLLMEDFPHELQGAEWGPDDETIFFSANLGVRSELFELNVATGETKQLTDGRHNLRSWAYSRANDAFLLSIITPQSPGEVYLLRRNDDAQPRPITQLHEGLADRFVVPEQRAIRFEAEDGMEIEALFSPPTDGSAPPYPLVVQSHGGPASSDRYGVWRWVNYRPVLSAMGYATLSVNYRGSTGYGDDFLRDMVGDYWRHAHTDVLAGVDHLVEAGLADPDRLAKMGWSAGGHMTNKMITFTDRFKAASSGAGAVDWVSMYGETDVRLHRENWFGGSAWSENAPLESYRRQSPLFEMWRVKTPTLIFVGEQDRRVPRTQSVMMSRALTAAGVPNRLYVAPGQGHGWSPLDQRLFKINAELAWFERYVRDRDYEWQSPPKDD